MEVTLNEFDDYVQRAIDGLAPAFKQYLTEVPVIVDNVPSAELSEKMQLGTGQLLLGLFQGIPLDRQATATGNVTQITLYRKNILAVCNNREQLIEQIRKTLVHELGHYLGFSEQQLRHHDY